jgi:hypothetical protein
MVMSPSVVLISALTGALVFGLHPEMRIAAVNSRASLRDVFIFFNFTIYKDIYLQLRV